MMHCLEHSIEGFFQPEIQDIIQAGAKQIHSFGTPLMGVGVPTPDPLYMIVKRILAFFFALILLILVSPILIGALLQFAFLIRQVPSSLRNNVWGAI